MAKIGEILENGTVEKEYCQQGFIFKDDEAFENKKGICYISEYGTENIKEDQDGCETYRSMYQDTKEAYRILGINPAKYPIKKLTAVVFDMLDWQSFGTLLYEVIESMEDRCFYKSQGR